MTAYTKSHKLRIYCVVVSSTTLLVLLLQIFAGVHS